MKSLGVEVSNADLLHVAKNTAVTPPLTYAL